MSLCASCYWNTVNDFFEPALAEENGQVTTVNQCVSNVQGYPHLRECAKYESAHRMDEE